MAIRYTGSDSVQPLFEDLKKQLAEKNIPLSYQRLKVLGYLVQSRSHPTVDMIYKDLKKAIPTLSKTTIYNTLRTLMQAGLVKGISIEDNETRYDIELDSHGHFKCESCGTIYNFSANIDSLQVEGLDDFKVNDRNVYYNGICPKCLSDMNSNVD